MYSFLLGHSVHSVFFGRLRWAGLTFMIALFGIVLLCGTSGVASAQVQRGQIAVDVRDVEGAPVEGAEVTLRPVQGTETYETQAVGDGEYQGEIPLQHLNSRIEVLVDAGSRGEGTGEGTWWSVGTVMRVNVDLGGGEGAEQESSQTSTDPDPSTTGEPVATTTSTIEIRSSRGDPITNATARVTIQSGLNVRETPTEETYTYDHLGDGTYEVQLEGLRDPGRYKYTVNLSAPHHASQKITPISLSGERSVELIHNNYVARCNQDWEDDEPGLLGNDSPWADCSVDPDRLIETFGTEMQEIGFHEEGVARIEEFELFRFHPSEPLSDVKVYDATSMDNYRGDKRLQQYRRLIGQVVRGPALAKAYAANEAIADLIEERRAAEEPSVEEVAARGASVVAGFAEEFSAAADAIGAAGEVLNVVRANERGVLKGIVHYAALRSGVQQETLKQFKRHARKARIWDDPSFRHAVEAVEETLEDQQQAGPEELANAYGRDEIADAVGDVLAGTTVKGGAKALLAAAKVGTAIKTAGAVLFYNFVERSLDRSQARVFLILAPLIDRQVLGRYPDTLEEADLKSLGPAEKRGILMRLALGTIYNESRAAYLTGENKSWLGQGWDFATEAMSIGTEADAYDAEMVRVSVEKSSRAKTEINRLGATLAHNDGRSSDDEDLATDQEVNTEAAMYRANPARTGHYPGSGPERPIRQEWRFEADGGIVFPAVADGTVYAGSGDNHLYALDAQTGQEQWRFETDGWVYAPAVADGTIYAGGEDNLYALGGGSGTEDKDQLITRVPFDEAPSSVKEKTRRFFQNSEPSVCFDTPKHASVYIVESIDEIRPIYFIWIFGCRKTRGRGSMGIFDGRSGNRIGNFFGYYITGSAGDVYVNTNSSSSYPELVIREEERKNVRLVFDESSGKYEYNTK